jgi:hypothetical protein
MGDTKQIDYTIEFTTSRPLAVQEVQRLWRRFRSFKQINSGRYEISSGSIAPSFASLGNLADHYWISVVDQLGDVADRPVKVVIEVEKDE